MMITADKFDVVLFDLAGGFGLVIGIDRHGDRRALAESGADIVVEDLGELFESTESRGQN